MRYFYSAYEAQAISEAHASQKIGWKFYLGATIYVAVVMAILFTLIPSTAQAGVTPSEANSESVVCDVRICNKLSRFSLNLWSHMKDSMGETCFDTQVAKKDAVVGKVLDSSTRFYQGSFNPTKKSVTKVKYVHGCIDMKTGAKL